MRVLLSLSLAILSSVSCLADAILGDDRVEVYLFSVNSEVDGSLLETYTGDTYNFHEYGGGLKYRDHWYDKAFRMDAVLELAVGRIDNRFISMRTQFVSYGVEVYPVVGDDARFNVFAGLFVDWEKISATMSDDGFSFRGALGIDWMASEKLTVRLKGTYRTESDYDNNFSWVTGNMDGGVVRYRLADWYSSIDVQYSLGNANGVFLTFDPENVVDTEGFSFGYFKSF